MIQNDDYDDDDGLDVSDSDEMVMMIIDNIFAHLTI